MISFDYLHPAQPNVVHVLSTIRFPGSLRAPLVALGAMFFAIACTWIAEDRRLGEVRHTESLYRQRFEESERELRALNLYYDRVQTLVRLDTRIRTIEASGSLRAAGLATIANALPAHSWLTSIASDAAGTTLEGKANNFSDLSSLVAVLSAKRAIGNASLVQAVQDEVHSGTPAVAFTIRVQKQ